MVERRASATWCGRVDAGRLAAACLVGVAVAAWAAPAAADPAADVGPGTRVYGSTTTFLTERQILDPNDPTSRLYQFPIYEYLTVGADNVGVPGLSLQVRGFGVIQPAHHLGEDIFTGDLLVGTLSYRDPKSRWQLTAGRQMVTTVASGFVLMDGVWVKARPGADMDIQAYGGWMPDAQFGYRKDRVAFGGRVAYDPWEKGRIGLSFAGEHDQGTISRATVALDYALRLVKGLECAGWTAFDFRSGGFQETGNSLSYKPHRDWRVSVDYGYFNPASRLPATSIFRVFTSARHHKVGAEVAWRSPGMLGMDFFGRYYNYGGDGNGYQLGFKPTLRTKGKITSTTGIEIGRVKSATNGYTEARIFTSVRPHRIFELTLDVDNFFYDDAVNGYDAWRRADPNGLTTYHYTGSGGYKRSNVVGLTAGVDLFRGARLQGDVAVTVNPDFTQRWSGLLKFQYAFSTYVK